jgi:RHS repeat-associated protein
LRLETDGTYTYAYDGEGNMVTKTKISDGTEWTYVWDYRNRLVEVQFDNSSGNDGIQYFTYDVFNRRVSQSGDAVGSIEANSPQVYFYDGDNMVIELVDIGASHTTMGDFEVSHKYLHGPAVDQVLADDKMAEPLYSPGRVLWYLSDQQNTTRDLVDNTGELVDHFRYDVFGQLLEGNSYLTRFFYTGAVFDIETGLGYHRARYLDHATGRWLSEDPIGFGAGDANLYRYVENGPSNATDPLGLQAQQSSITITAITPKQLTVTFINLKGDEFSAQAGIPGARAISEAILKGILNQILFSFNVTGVGKVLFVQFAGIELAAKLQMQTVRSDIDVTVELTIKECKPSGTITSSTATKSLKIQLATVDLGAGGVSAHDKTGIVNALNKIKNSTKDRLQKLNGLVYSEIKKLYPNEKVVPLK